MSQNNDVNFSFEFDKALAVLLYLAQHSESVPDLTKGKAAKLIFLAEKYHLVRYGRPIMGEEYRALPLGPIPQHLLDLLDWLWEGGGTYPYRPECGIFANRVGFEVSRYLPVIVAKSPPDLNALSDSDVEALDHVIKVYGQKSFEELSDITHKMPAYRIAWSKRGPDSSMYPMSYLDFFKEDRDATPGAYEEMLEDALLRRALTERQ